MRGKRVGLNLKGVVIIVGNYGSGKSEVAVNLAVHRRRTGCSVRIADLDLVNPYFRTREARRPLAALGIEVILPPERYLHADLPILDPAVAGAVLSPGDITILDAGGDGVGATVLAALADAFRDRPVRMLQVVNPYRPFTETIQGCQQIRAQIESAARMTIDGIIGNANLMGETTAHHIYEGYQFVRDLAAAAALPLEFVTAAAPLLPRLDPTRFACPLLPIERQLVTPWVKAAPLGPKNLRSV
jgi:hypothetical protein